MSRESVFMCLHFEISSVLLLRMLLPLNNTISSFSCKQRLHLSDDWLKREHFRRILHFILGTEFICFIFQISFKSSVSFLYVAFVVTISFFKCGFCYTYVNLLAVGLFITCDGGIIWEKPSTLSTPTKSFNFSYVSRIFVERELKSLKRRKAASCDDLPPEKDAAYALSNPLTHLINLSLPAGLVPNKWKITKVPPIHKKRKHQQL